MSLAGLFAPYVEPVSTATAVFPLAASLSVLPFALYHYRHHGWVHPWRALLSYSFVYYMIAVVFLVVFPLPEMPRNTEFGEWQGLYDRFRTPRLDPTGFFRDLLRTRAGRARTIALVQAISNALLLLPFGAYLVYLFKRRIRAAGGLAFLFSVLLELCQLTGDFWIYPGPYRLFDAGDIVLNTCGALIGAAVTALLVHFRILPALDTLKGPESPWIGPLRRGIALLIDGIAAVLSATGLSVIVQSLLGDSAPYPLFIVGGLAFWLILVPVLDGGRGLGKGLTFCAVKRRNGKVARRGRILLRELLLWAPPLTSFGVMSLSAPPAWLRILILSIGAVWLILTAADLRGLVVGREKDIWVDRCLDTRVRNTWKPITGGKNGRSRGRARN